MRTIWSIFFILLLAGQNSANNIIPEPKITHSGGSNVDWKVAVAIFSIDYSPILERYPISAKAISLAKALPIHLNSEPSSIQIRLRIRGQNLNYDNEISKMIPDSVWDNPEGYVLEINQDEVSIYGFDQAGLLYGVQSLRQIISEFKSGNAIGVQTIIDYPTFSFRGIMDDISRGPLSNMKFLKEQIDRLSLLKVNVVSFYTEHILKTQKHFAYAPLDGLSIAELRSLSEYADSLNIKIMGSFQSLGHFKEILAHPNYRPLGASERMLKPAEGSSLQFLFENYDELIPVSSHPIFNINCDEAYDLDRGPALNDLATEIGKGNVYFNHIYPLLQHVQKQGKTPALWGDVLLQYPEIINKLPPGTVVFTWNYLDLESYADFIQPFASRNIPFIVTPGIVNSYRVWPDLHEATNNISNFSYEGWKEGARGVLTTVWDDGGRHFFTSDWFGVAVGAEHSWNPEEINHSGFADKFHQIFYQGKGNACSRLLDNLHKFQETNRLKNLDNSLLEMRLDINESNGFIDTSEFKSVLKIIDQTKQNIFHLVRNISNEGLFPSTDFNVWLFKMNELEESILSAESICEINKLKTNTLQTDKSLTTKIDSIAKVRQRKNQDLADQFSILWYKENRDYAFSELNQTYNAKIAFWKDISSLAVSQNFGSIPVYQATSDKYFTYWLSAGPFSLTSRENIKTDFFKDWGGENNLRPGAIDYYPDRTGEYLSWKKIISPKPDYVNLDQFYPNPNLKAFYMNCQLYVENDWVVSYELRFPGRHQIILNGQLLDNQLNESPGLSDGELSLKAGRNDLIVKILTTSSSENSFLFFLPGQAVTSAKYRYYLKDPVE